MSMNVGREYTALREMTTRELQQKYRDVFGEPTRMHHKQYLIKRILWRMQANEQGDLSERARRQASELANDADLRLYAPSREVESAGAPERTKTFAFPVASDDRLPMPGSVLTRKYKGRLIQVLVRPDGFEYDGIVHRTLSAVAKAATGTHWNGFHFFALGKYRKAE